MLQHKPLLMSWKGKFPDGQLPEPVPHHALLGTRCSAFVVFTSCLWRLSRNDVDWCNTIWWSSPPIRLCIADYLNHFIQCVARMNNRKLFVQSFCDALEVVPRRPFFFVCLKWQHLKKKINLRMHNEPKPHPLTCSQARLKDGCIVSCLNFEFTGRF